MARPNELALAPPYAVETAIKSLGDNLRTARLRRGLSIQDLAQKIGTHRRVVADAERGKPTTSILVYAALLWAFNLDEQLASVAAPASDEEGLALVLSHERKRARGGETLNNDF